jgi:coenzyme PQQ precursor peptide PqqA
MRYGMATSPQAPTGAVQRASRRPSMQWQTPTAIDWRFGFEISLYIANR